MASKKSSKKKSSKTGSAADGAKTISENRKATHKFEILEKIECGIMLLGPEVKSLRDGKLSLAEAYVRVENGELWLIGADIAQFKQASFWNHQPKRQRKLLVHKRELKKLSERAFEKGLTLVPLRMFFNTRGIVKVVVGVGRGKKIHDKRESKKTADVKRQISREMRERRK
jgi:SsrA-binding protein